GTLTVPDYKLMYSAGDRGANQFSNACDSLESQYIISAAELAAGNLRCYSGKILRLNVDGSIPSDNPIINGVKSHIWSYGHRNPQGLSFQKSSNNVLVPKGKLYSSEQGPATNDEINIIDSANNYGWPRVAGKKDNNWYKYYKWAGSVSPTCGSYSSECSATQTNNGQPESGFSHSRYMNPIFDLYPGTPPLVSGVPNTCNWLTYPTVAPSSVVYYPYTNKIPGWGNCLLITTLKTSSIFRLKLNAAGTSSLSVSDSVIQYFRDNAALNRYRDIVIGNDGITLYVITDSVGGTSGPSAGTNSGVTDRGSILEYKYTGALLAIGNDPATEVNNRLNFNMYPNPVSTLLTVECKRNVAKPIQYHLYDASGRIVREGQTIRNRFEIDVRLLKKGLYIIKLYNAYNIVVATEKIIVN
ncbi:MAG: PQQ-dependent sugar dehydrogenase, partial [Ferruginibacter sp.]